MEIISPLGEHTVVEKHDVTLECEISKPNHSALWYRGKKLIKASDRFVIKVNTVQLLAIYCHYCVLILYHDNLYSGIKGSGGR